MDEMQQIMEAEMQQASQKCSDVIDEYSRKEGEIAKRVKFTDGHNAGWIDGLNFIKRKPATGDATFDKGYELGHEYGTAVKLREVNKRGREAGNAYTLTADVEVATIKAAVDISSMLEVGDKLRAAANDFLITLFSRASNG